MEADAEIEALRSIFGDEISVNSNHDRSLTTVRKKVRPNDEEGVSSASIVVEFELGPEYPEVSPKVRLSNPRGISEQSHHQLIEEVSQRLRELRWSSCCHCADFILEHQHSSSLACPICLCPLTSAGVSATPCDHYAHTECLELHAEHTRKQLGEKLAARGFKMCDDVDRVGTDEFPEGELAPSRIFIQSLRCPVCRVVIEEEVEPILQPSPPGRRRRASLKERETTPARRLVQQGSHTDFEFDWERWRQQQASLMAIYERQKQKGGIIDLEEERKKNLITEDTVVELTRELENLITEPSISGPVQTNDEVEPAHVTSDAPPGFEDVLPANPPPHSQHQRGGNTHRGRGRGRRFHDGHYRGGNRGGGRREHHSDKNQAGTVDSEGPGHGISPSALTSKQGADVAGESSQERRGNVYSGSGPKRHPHHRGRYHKTGHRPPHNVTERAPPVSPEHL
ncbi:RWD domain protein [Cooperia oncophora]